MPLVVAHFLATAGIMKVTRLRLASGALSFKELFICALIGVLPDIDFLVQFITGRFGFYPHRVFTHSIFVPIVLLAIGLLLCRRDVNRYASTLFFLASLAFAAHILLDLALAGPVLLLAPFSWEAIGFNTCKKALPLLAGLDAILLVSWLFFRGIKA